MPFLPVFRPFVPKIKKTYLLCYIFIVVLVRENMKKRLSFKKIISLILVATIAGASLCLLTACGNNKTINDTYANDGEILYCRSYKLEKDKNYVINITDNFVCTHTLSVKVDIENQGITIESGNYLEFNDIGKVVWDNKATVTLNKGKYYNYEKKHQSVYRIKITPKSNCTLSYSFMRYFEAKENINLTSTSSSSYSWTASYTPGGTPAVTKVRLFLTKADAKKLGNIFANESVLNCIKTISESQSKDVIYSKIEDAISAAAKSEPTSGTEVVVGALTALSKLISDHVNLSKQLKTASKSLLNATQPMGLDFEVGTPEYNNYLSYVTAYSLQSMKDTSTGKYYLFAPVGHEGTFAKAKF